MISPEHNPLDVYVPNEVHEPFIDLSVLAVGSRVRLVLGEDDDCLRQAQLDLRLREQASEDTIGKFTVEAAVLDPKIIAAWSKFKIDPPELMGGELWVRFAATLRRGFESPITMARNNAIVEGRHLFMAVPAPTIEKPKQWVDYNAAVLEARIIR